MTDCYYYHFSSLTALVFLVLACCFLLFCGIWVKQNCNQRFFSSSGSMAPYITAKRFCSIWANKSCNQRFLGPSGASASYITAKRYLQAMTPNFVGDEAHSTEHGTPQEGLECLACFEDIDGSNYVEYTAVQDGPWLPSLFCRECVERLLESQWETYVKQLSAASCKAEQTRMLERGPPMNLRDPSALPCPGGGEVALLWFSADGRVKSAKLDGSLEGKERQEWWDEKLAFQFDEPDDE